MSEQRHIKEMTEEFRKRVRSDMQWCTDDASLLTLNEAVGSATAIFEQLMKEEFG